MTNTTALKHPRSVFILSVCAIFQNYSVWGVISFFPILLTQVFSYPQDIAAQYYGWFIGMTMALPVLGGYLATVLRRYSLAITISNLFLISGCLLLTFALTNGILFLIALSCIALAYGLYWPAIYALNGRLYENKPLLRNSGFTLLYAFSSIGILLTQVINNYLIANYSWNTFYLLLAFTALLSQLSLMIWRNRFRSIDQVCPPTKQQTNAVNNSLTVIEKKRIKVIILLALFSMIYWMGCTQMGSAAIFFAKRHAAAYLFDEHISATTILATFTLFIILLGPIFSWLWRYLDEKGITIYASNKMAIAMLMVSFSFLLLAIVARDITSVEQQIALPLVYLLLFYALQAIGAIIMGPIGIAFVEKWSPAAFTPLLIGLWFVGIGLGGVLGGTIDRIFLGKLLPFYFFLLFFTVITTVAILLLVAGRWIQAMLHNTCLTKQ